MSILSECRTVGSAGKASFPGWTWDPIFNEVTDLHLGKGEEGVTRCFTKGLAGLQLQGETPLLPVFLRR